MPVASSSRRKQHSRRQNSEDIEDAHNTQADVNADEVSDEDRPRTGKKVQVKKEPGRKSNGKQKGDPEDEDEEEGNEEDDEEADDDRINVKDFPDQPLRKADLPKLLGISEDWLSMQRQINQNVDIYNQVAAAMAEAGEKDMQSSTDLQQLDCDIKEFIDVTAEMGSHSRSLKELHQRVAQGQEITNSLQVYRDGVETLKNEYAAKTTRQRYGKDKRYSDFHSAIWEVHHPKEPMHPLTEIIPKEDGDESDSDDDLEMGGVTQNYDCPITLTLMVNPVTSRVCQHSFSADSIKEHFRSGPTTKKCPAAGCNKLFKLSDCLPDKTLAKKVEAYARRLAVNAEDSDAEEVVDD